jgi:hypothetical protein
MKANGKRRIRNYIVTLNDGTTRRIEGTRLEEAKTGIMIWNGRKAVISFEWSELKSILQPLTPPSLSNS